MATFLDSVLPGLQGLQNTQAQSLEMQAFRQRQADDLAAQDLLADYQKAGNQDALVGAVMKSPQLANNVLSTIGLVDKQKQQSAASDIAELWQLKDNPEAFKRKVAVRANAILERGGDPQNTLQLAALYEQDPMAAIGEMKAVAAGLESKGYQTGVFAKQEKAAPYQQGTGDAAGFVFDPNTGTYSASPQVREAIANAKTAADAKDGKIDAKTVISLNDKIGGLTKDAMMIHNTAKDISKLKKIGGGPASISIVYKFMKSLDPTSVVREGEFATAANAGGVPENIMNFYNKIVSGERLPESVIDDFERTAMDLSDSASESAGGAVGDYLNTFEDQLPQSLKDKLKERVPKRFNAQPAKQQVQQQAPVQAVELLRNNPQLKEQFKAKYGYIPEGL